MSSDPARKSFFHSRHGGSVTLLDHGAYQDSENDRPCDRSNSSKRALVSTHAGAAASVGKRHKLSTAKENTDTSSMIPPSIIGGLYQSYAPLQASISVPLLEDFETNLPHAPLMEASWADDLFVDDQGKIPGNSASSTENNGSTTKLSRLQDFVFESLAGVNEIVDCDYLFDTSSSLRRLSAAGSEATRPRPHRQQNTNPDIQPAMKPSFLIWKQQQQARPANLGLPQFPVLEDEEEGEMIVVADEGKSMLIPPEPTTPTATLATSSTGNPLHISQDRNITRSQCKYAINTKLVSCVDKLLSNIILSISTIRSLLALTSFPFRSMYASDAVRGVRVPNYHVPIVQLLLQDCSFLGASMPTAVM
jgi:hypothetical protein